MIQPPSQANTLCSPSTAQIIWFLAPTVSLCEQQYKVIRTALPGESPKLIVGSDNVESWRNPAAWKKLLSRRIFVSTPEILSQTLNHGFVTIGQLGLLIFDEGKSMTRQHTRLADSLTTQHIIAMVTILLARYFETITFRLCRSRMEVTYQRSSVSPQVPYNAPKWMREP